MSYNGWTNHETWCVSLWLANDTPAVADAATLAARQGPDALRDLTEGYIGLGALGGCLASDLLTSALEEVNWQEICDTWKEG